MSFVNHIESRIDAYCLDKNGKIKVKCLYVSAYKKNVYAPVVECIYHGIWSRWHIVKLIEMQLSLPLSVGDWKYEIMGYSSSPVCYF